MAARGSVLPTWLWAAPLVASLAWGAPPEAGGATTLPAGATAYLHDASTPYLQPKWMAGLDEATPLSRISMVGTHDACTFYGGDIVQNQSLSLTNQLNMGVRAVDLRLREVNNVFQVYHGIVDQKRNGQDAVAEIVAFLKANPTETVVVRISDTGEAKNSTKSWEEVYQDQIFNHFRAGNPRLFWDKAELPRLKDVRGRMVVLVDFPATGKVCYGPKYGAADIQDDFAVATNWDLYGKWEKVKAFMDKALDPGRPDRLVLNYLSAAKGSFPYFVASGKASPGTGASQLLTGLTTLTSKAKYPDFPRVGCLKSLCSIAFMGTNQLAADYLEKRMVGIQGVAKGAKTPAEVPSVGILMADFPGPQLVDTVIRANRFGTSK